MATFWKGNPAARVRQSKSVRKEPHKRTEPAYVYETDWLVDTRLKKELPKLGLCKIRPERIRDLSLYQLERAKFSLGPVTMKERVSNTNPRGLLFNLLTNLIGAQVVEDLSPRSAEAYRKTYGEEPASSEDIRASYRRGACRVEKKIYDAQQKKGCKLAETDVAARDELRRQSCDAPYPTERLNKIRGRRKATIRGPKIK